MLGLGCSIHLWPAQALGALSPQSDILGAFPDFEKFVLSITQHRNTTMLNFCCGAYALRPRSGCCTCAWQLTCRLTPNNAVYLIKGFFQEKPASYLHHRIAPMPQDSPGWQTSTSTSRGLCWLSTPSARTSWRAPRFPWSVYQAPSSRACLGEARRPCTGLCSRG